MYKPYQPDWMAVFGSNDGPDRFHQVALDEARASTDYRGNETSPRAGLLARVRSFLRVEAPATAGTCCPSPA